MRRWPCGRRCDRDSGGGLTVASEDRITEVVDRALENGDAAACEAFGIAAESLGRYKRDYRAIHGDLQHRKILRDISTKFTDAELRAIVKSGAFTPGGISVRPVSFEGELVTMGVVADTHWGSKFSPAVWWDSALEEFRRRKIDFLVHAGDVTEGMSQRPGHIYELSHIGYDEQKEYATSMLAKWTDTPAYAVDGNHDRWFIKSSGAKIVKDICDALPNWTFLGHDTGVVPIEGGVKVQLWHGEDGAAYALSYRVQKIVESIAGGTKPNVLLCAHAHKSIYTFLRNIHCFECGCLQAQTDWMRGTRKSAYPGFWVVELVISGCEVKSITSTWYPFYA